MTGPVRVWTAKTGKWSEVKLTHGYEMNSRGVGVADMACALLSGRAHRANGKLAYHVLDVMLAINDASKSGKHVKLTSACAVPKPLPTGLKHG